MASDDMTKVEEAQALKIEGNDHFRNGAYTDALKCYNRVVLATQGLIKMKAAFLESNEIMDDMKKL
jgi:hypothetical protein